MTTRLPVHRQRGVSLVELMVGAAVGLLLIAAIVTLYVSSLSGGRKLALDARLNQDLRAAADLVARDLRRASFWDASLSGTTIASSGATTPNPYRAVTPDSGSTVQEILYMFSRDATENNTADDNEKFGFRLTNAGVLEMKTRQDENWHAITNPGVVRITAFNIDPSQSQEISLGYLCPTTCGAGTPNCPTTRVRRYQISITGQSVADANITRALQSTVRLRNDRLEGQCPA